jgi:hypothetical protein
VPPDREEAAIGATPEVVVAEMSDVTGRLGDRLWMVAPMTAGIVNADPEIQGASDAPASPQE